jgi:biotin carboxyl carrier protein
MRYFVTIDGQTFEVDLSDRGVVVNGETLTVELSAVPGTPVRRLAVDGSSHVVHVGNGDTRHEWNFHLDGERFTATVQNERQHTIAAMTGADHRTHGPRPVKAPMPGLVVRVEVKAGDQVKAGQGVVIIEAMKMENELRAEVAGVVGKVHVAAGETVEKGTLLVEFAEQ